MENIIIKQIQRKIIVNEFSLNDLQEGILTEPPKYEEWLDYPYLDDIKSLYTGNRESSKKYQRIISMEISNCGNIRITRYVDDSCKDTETLSTEENSDKKLEIKDDLEEDYFRLPEYPGFDNIYRLVADTWLDGGKKGMVVHHIDNDGKHNYISNLIWVTKEEHYQIHHGNTNRL